jgi:hypothetical protein
VRMEDSNGVDQYPTYDDSRVDADADTDADADALEEGDGVGVGDELEGGGEGEEEESRTAEEADAAAEIELIRAELLGGEYREVGDAEADASGESGNSGDADGGRGTDAARMTPHGVSEEELEAILELALGPQHAAELSKKVEAAMQEDWDIQQGVNTIYTVSAPKKPPPLKANVDLWSYHAR